MPDRNDGAKEKEAIALRERFDGTIRFSFGGDSEVVKVLLNAANNEIRDAGANRFSFTINRPDRKIWLGFANQWGRSLAMSVEKNDSVESKSRSYSISHIEEITCDSENNGILIISTKTRKLNLDINEGTITETDF
jgi:hypothetical protein